MKEFIKSYLNQNEDKINFDLMNRVYDGNLVDYLVDSCKSLEALKYIEFLGYDYNDDETTIDLNHYMTTRKRSKKKTDIKYMYMSDSRYGELTVKFKITYKSETCKIKKKILVPVPDENGYYTLKGKKYLLLYQLVEASTYTTRQNLILKSLMPFVVKRQQHLIDINNTSFSAPLYCINLFKKEINLILFYFAKMGVKKTLQYFSVNYIIKFVDSKKDEEENIYFNINSKMFLEVSKRFFNKYQYIQSLVAMIMETCSNRLSFSDLEDKTHWIEKIGSMTASSIYNYYDKGVNTLVFFDRFLDETTRKILKVHSENKKNIYSITRWIIQNYNELRKKDNLDLANKRLRCNEEISSLLTRAFSDRVNRIISLGNKVTIDKIKEIFKFPGDILIQQLYKSGLLRYDDRINDMNFFSKFRFTIKGPNSLGNKNENNIGIKYRGIHPSYIGKVDINVCGNSDPGTSGVITPFCKTYGLHFNDENEPEDFKYNFEKDIESYRNEINDSYIINLGVDNIQDYFEMQGRFRDFNKRMTITETQSNEDVYFIKINANESDDDI